MSVKSTTADLDAEVALWNECLRLGDEIAIQAQADRLLTSIHERQLEDWNVHQRTGRIA